MSGVTGPPLPGWHPTGAGEGELPNHVIQRILNKADGEHGEPGSQGHEKALLPHDAMGEGGDLPLLPV